MKPVSSSALEAEIGALFDNCKKATILWTTLHEMGWQQPATLIQTDNSTACWIANDSIKNNDQGPYTCISTGSEIAASRDILIFFGDQEQPT
jgi:hypothetical protein